MKYFIKTYGCQMNKADSLWLGRIFEEFGYTEASSLEEADVVLINSCSVRQAAEDKVYGLAKKIRLRRTVAGETRPIPQPPQEKPSRFKDSNLEGWGMRRFSSAEPVWVILTGCMVGSAMGKRRRIKLSDLKKKMPWVDYFIPPGEIFERLPEILSSDEAACERVRKALGKPGAVVLEKSVAGEDSPSEVSEVATFRSRSERRRGLKSATSNERRELASPGRDEGREAYVPVMRGCDQFCSYCVVPYGRGPETSRPMEEIVDEVKNLVKRGVSKVTLLGQNVNSYGKGFGPSRHSEFISESDGREEGQSGQILKQVQDDEKIRIEGCKYPFVELLRRLHEIKGLEKIWFLTSNPWDFSDDLIDALALPKIEKYLHLPVQSGDDEILRKMNRPYTAREYKELVRKIREKVPEIKLGTDIIVGFPGESEEQFQNTVDLVKEIGFEGAFVAMYSPRPGTAAAKLYKDDVPLEKKKRRHKVILDLVKKRRGEKG